MLSFALALILSIYGCAAHHVTNTTTPAINLSTENNTNRLNEVILFSTATNTAVKEEYRIGPGDVLEIEAYNVEELQKTVRVNFNREIALPLVGIIKAGGMTTRELEKVIANRLDRYVEETVVSVFIKEYRSQRISVVGAVEKPQIYAVTGQSYLIDMLALAGGLTKEAGNICYVIRPTVENSKYSSSETMVIDLDELLINGNVKLNIPVFAGDVINVPKGGIVFVDGAVKKPGAFTMQGKTTLIQAIAMAQGLDSGAQPREVRIFRVNSKKEKDIVSVDYVAIQKGESPDILLVENDIIIVPESGIKNFFNSFVNAIKGFITFGFGRAL